MTEQRNTILKRLGQFIPNVEEEIATLYGIDTKKAKVMYQAMCKVEEAIRDLLFAQVEVTGQQADFIASQVETTKVINRQIDKERDALLIFMNLDQFLLYDPPTRRYVLSLIFKDADEFAAYVGSMEDEKQIEYFAALRKGINSLKRTEHGLLAEPVE